MKRAGNTIQVAAGSSQPAGGKNQRSAFSIQPSARRDLPRHCTSGRIPCVSPGRAGPPNQLDFGLDQRHAARMARQVRRDAPLGNFFLDSRTGLK